MSRITIIASGSRGDVQPAIALGVALIAAGHSVRLLAGSDFRYWIETHGIEAAPSRVDIGALLASDTARRWLESGNRPLQWVRLLRSLISGQIAEHIVDAWEASADADLIVSGVLSDTWAVAFAEKRQVPAVSMSLAPALFATRDGRAMISTPLPNRVSLINEWLGKVFVEPLLWSVFGVHVNRFRQEIGLPPQTSWSNTAARRRMTVLHAISRHVMPLPSDWPANFHVTGYWFLDDARPWDPPDALLAFLASGPPPVCITFGSMTGRDPEGTARLIVDAVQQSGHRAIVLAGGGAIARARLPGSMLRIPEGPHDWLFPRVAGVVHHGGAGTTAAALRAGVPSVVVPHGADQLYWGRRVQELGVGPQPLPRQRLTSKQLAAAMRRIAVDEQMRRNSADMGRRIRVEDGTAVAVDIIGRCLRGWSVP